MTADPANDLLPYESVISITELVEVDEVMTVEGLGPNGALLHCMQVLADNIHWLVDKLKQYQQHYFIFDFPGQVARELLRNRLHLKTL